MLLRGHIQMIKGKGKGVARSFLNVEGGGSYVHPDKR